MGEGFPIGRFDESRWGRVQEARSQGAVSYCCSASSGRGRGGGREVSSAGGGAPRDPPSAPDRRARAEAPRRPPSRAHGGSGRGARRRPPDPFRSARPRVRRRAALGRPAWGPGSSRAAAGRVRSPARVRPRAPDLPRRKRPLSPEGPQGGARARPCGPREDPPPWAPASRAPAGAPPCPSPGR